MDKPAAAELPGAASQPTEADLRNEAAQGNPPTTGAPAPAVVAPQAKIGRILDDDEAGFGFEYDDTLGRKNTMRLDALTYEGAIREARSYLGIQPDDHDADGSRWEIE